MTVPSAIPGKPSPCQPPTPRLSIMLAMILVTFTTRSVIIELIESCIPMNQPLKDIRERVAGAAQMRMKKYLRARVLTSGEQSTARKASFVKGHWTARVNAARPSASSRALASNRPHSFISPRPRA